MISPAALIAQRASQSAEGRPAPLAPPRPWRWKRWVLLVGVCYGGWCWFARKPEVLAGPVLSQHPPAPAVAPSSGFFSAVTAQKDSPELLWVVGNYGGFVFDGKTYAVRTADTVGRWSVGMLGPDWADVHDGTSVSRLRVVFPYSALAVSTARRGADRGGTQVPRGQGGVGSLSRRPSSGPAN